MKAWRWTLPGRRGRVHGGARAGAERAQAGAFGAVVWFSLGIVRALCRGAPVTPAAQRAQGWARSHVGEGRLSTEGHPASKQLCRVKMTML